MVLRMQCGTSVVCWKVAVPEMNAERKLPHCSKAEALKISPRQG